MRTDFLAPAFILDPVCKDEPLEAGMPIYLGRYSSALVLRGRKYGLGTRRLMCCLSNWVGGSGPCWTRIWLLKGPAALLRDLANSILIPRNCSSSAGLSMKTAVSHLAAGICQTVFMNSIYCPSLRTAAHNNGGKGWASTLRRMGSSRSEQDRGPKCQHLLVCG